LVKIFLTQLAIKSLFKFPPHQRLLSHYLGKADRVEMNEKTSVNFIYSNLWASTAGLYKIWLSCSSFFTR